MKLMMGMVATSTLVALSAVAQEAGTDASTMTCAEFVALDTAGQNGAMASIQAAAVAAASAIQEGTGVDAAAADGDAMASTDTETTSGNMVAAADPGSEDASGEAETETTVAGDDAHAGIDLGAILLEACSGVPDMRVTDAMMQVQASDSGDGDGIDSIESDAGEASGG